MNRGAFLLLTGLLLLMIPTYAMIKNAATGSRHDKYPPTRDCSLIFAMFDHDVAHEYGTALENHREIMEHDMEATLEGKGLGFYQCFCIRDGKKKDENENCADYKTTKLWQKGYSYSISIGTLILNLLFKYFVQYVVDYQQLHTHSERF